METVGFTRQQAEAMAEEQAKLVDEKLATKLDLETVKNELEVKIEALRTELKADIEQSRLANKADLAETKADMIKWVIGVGLAQTTVLVAVLKLHV